MTRRYSTLLVALAFGLCAAGMPAQAGTQNDAGSGTDAGGTFEDALPITAVGRHTGRLAPTAGDKHDFYRFPIEQGASLSMVVTIGEGVGNTDPVVLLDPNGVPIDVSVKQSGEGISTGAAFTGEAPFVGGTSYTGNSVVRLTIYEAPVAGDYRLHLSAEIRSMGSYSICFMNCEGAKSAPIDMIFGGSLRQTKTSVLLVPPMHGDLGDPLGPTVLDYIDATVRGIRRWTTSMDAFAAAYPQYSFLRQIDVDIEIFDEVDPVDPIGYDVVIGYVAAGPVFRGVASGTLDSGQGAFDLLLKGAHFPGRTILLSLFGSAPRAGQVVWDFPEVTDLEIVTMHEFGHTFGLGHTTTWDATLGFDLMNSPAAFIYGNGSPVGDGGQHTPMTCLSSLDLYGMAYLYRWVPTGTWQGSYGSRTLPSTIPYAWFC